jgi:hypothetical protein
MSNPMTAIEDATIPPALAWVAPIEVDRLVRLGGDNDGGYVVPEEFVRKAKALVSLGVGSSWQFEKDARTLNPSLRIHAYDHTVSAKLFARQYVAEIAAFLTGKVEFAKVRRRRQRLRDYRSFFGRDATHFKQRIHDRLDSESVDLATVFERAGPGDLFVKMDIEGAEYRVLDQLVAHSDRILGLVIEFHDTGPLRSAFERCMQLLLDHFKVVHFHANNFAPTYRDGFPEALEITLVRMDLVPGTRKRTQLPIPGLDQPNDPRRPDYQLTFG